MEDSLIYYQIVTPDLGTVHLLLQDFSAEYESTGEILHEDFYVVETRSVYSGIIIQEN